MAYKLVLPGSPDGLPFIWNISQHVGCYQCPNLPTDVELVQFMLKGLVDAGQLGHEGVTGLRTPPLATGGSFNAVLGFWIFYLQTGGKSSATVDGIMSPAKGTSYGGGVWAITKLNHVYKECFPAQWANLSADVRLSPPLRAQLQKTTP
jgi:hypothetical protein